MDPANREAAFPRLHNLALEVQSVSTDALHVAAEIHDRLFGPRPQGDRPETAKDIPSGFTREQEVSLERTLENLHGTLSDLRRIGSELGIPLPGDARAVRAVAR